MITEHFEQAFEYANKLSAEKQKSVSIYRSKGKLKVVDSKDKIALNDYLLLLVTNYLPLYRVVYSTSKGRNDDGFPTIKQAQDRLEFLFNKGINSAKLRRLTPQEYQKRYTVSKEVRTIQANYREELKKQYP